MAEAKGALKAKEIEEFGVRLTIFSNGDVYVSTPADIHIIQAKHIFGKGWRIGSDYLQRKERP